MNFIDNSDFRVDYLPPLIKDAVMEMYDNTGFPISLIVSSVFGAISAGCQNSINVQLPIGPVVPCSLYLMLIAESGEGKSPIDKLCTKPFRDFEEDVAKEIANGLSQQKAEREIWEIEYKEIKKEISKTRRKQLLADNHDDINQLDVKFENFKKKLELHLAIEPKQKRKWKFIKNNITIQKLILDFEESGLSTYLNSDEGDSLFRGEVLKDMGLLNQIWDGTPINRDRVSSPSVNINEPRLTIAISVQPQSFTNFYFGRGKNARDLGFLARFLIARPYSTKGTRLLLLNNQSHPATEKFQQRISEIITENKLNTDQGNVEKTILHFTQEAKWKWVAFRNKIELDIFPGRFLSDISDFASKLAVNVARMAALFHFFGGCSGDISAETLDCAINVCVWYIDEFKRLFSKHPEVPIWVSDSWELEKTLVHWCQNHSGRSDIQKSEIPRYAPYHLRKNKNGLEAALNQLAMDGKVMIFKFENKYWVRLNPSFFPIGLNVVAQNPYPLARIQPPNITDTFGLTGQNPNDLQ